MYRLDDIGTRQRQLHLWLIAAVLLCFVVMGTPGWLVYGASLLVFHARGDNARGHSVMDNILGRRDEAIARAWTALRCSTGRREVSLGGRKPHRLVSALLVIASLAVAAVFGERISEAPLAYAITARIGIALVTFATIALAVFGVSRRTPCVFGADGVRVRETFVAYSTMIGLRQEGHRVTLERASPLPEVRVSVADSTTAGRLVEVLDSERTLARARHAATVPLLPAATAGFRENASQLGWRVRVFNAASEEERHAAIARVAPEELRELLDETADPSLEDAVLTHLARTK